MLLSLIAPLSGAEKKTALELVELAKSHSADLLGAIPASFDA